MSDKKIALVLGANGQDGSYMVDLLLEKGYTIFATHNYGADLKNLAEARLHPEAQNKLNIVKMDLNDDISLYNLIHDSKADEIYNFADMDDVSWSYVTPHLSLDTTLRAVLTIIRAMMVDKEEPPRYLQPLSALMFGPDNAGPQNEFAAMDPRSPYACAKAAAWIYCKSYRKTYGLDITCPIFFNHDSPRRSEGYLLHSICKQAAEVACGIRKKIRVGDTEQLVDIGHAKDYVAASYAMMRWEVKADDYVISTGYTVPIGYCVGYALTVLGVLGDKEDYIEVDSSLLRPGKQPRALYGATTKAHRSFGFSRKYTIQTLIQELTSKYKKEVVR